MAAAWLDRRPPTGASTPSVATRPWATSRPFSRWNSAVTPSSLNREAMVPNTGSPPVSAEEPRWSRPHWRQTWRKASSAPRRSNLLMATTSANSSMPIFSSWEAAPYSGVIT